MGQGIQYLDVGLARHDPVHGQPFLGGNSSEGTELVLVEVGGISAGQEFCASPVGGRQQVLLRCPDLVHGRPDQPTAGNLALAEQPHFLVDPIAQVDVLLHRLVGDEPGEENQGGHAAADPNAETVEGTHSAPPANSTTPLRTTPT